MMAEPDQGSGADEGVRPTPKYLANFWPTTIVSHWRAETTIEEVSDVLAMRLLGA